MKPFQNPFNASKDKMSRFIFCGILVLVCGCLLIVLGTVHGNNTQIREKSDAETKLKEMIDELDGVENACVMLLIEDNGKISGAAVVCNGGEDADNQKTIIDLITSLYGIGASKVFVGGK